VRLRQIQVLLALGVVLLCGCTQALPRDAPPHGTPYACTSYAVYAGETFYGMNFDYPDVELRFAIADHGDGHVFQMTFEEDGDFVPTVGMNSAGVFANMQMLFPEVALAPRSDANEVYVWEVYRSALFDSASVDQVAAYLEDKRVIQWGRTLHSLVADVHGEAMVVEAGAEGNVITPIEGDYIVMANFPNGDYRELPYDQVRGAGAGRYVAAYEHIRDHIDEYDLDRALETLEQAVQRGEASGTQSSMVFLPERRDVYIALKGDFSRVWRVSLEERTIETYAGFDGTWRLPLRDVGILASDMQRMGAARAVPWSVILGTVVVLGGGACYLVIRKRRSEG
jgi:hypothetical protein